MGETYILKTFDCDILIQVFSQGDKVFVKCTREDNKSTRILKVHSTKYGRLYFVINNCRYYLSELIRI